MNREQQSLQKQKAVLDWFKKTGQAGQAFQDLKALSPEKLKPVLCFSQQHGHFLGFLVQRVGNGGYRVLVPELKTWKLLRVKRNAQVFNMDRPIEKNWFKRCEEDQRIYLSSRSVLLEQLESRKQHDLLRSQKRIRAGKAVQKRPGKVPLGKRNSAVA